MIDNIRHKSIRKKTASRIAAIQILYLHLFNDQALIDSVSTYEKYYKKFLLKIKNLTFIDINSPKINKITKDFYSDNKRVSNKKIKKILGWTPKFENYKLGLKEILNIINGKNTANNPLS